MDDKEQLNIKLNNIKKLTKYSVLAAIFLILLATLLVIFCVYLIIYAIALGNSTEPVNFDTNMFFMFLPIGILLGLFIVFFCLRHKYKKLIQ